MIGYDITGYLDTITPSHCPSLHFSYHLWLNQSVTKPKLKPVNITKSSP